MEVFYSNPDCKTEYDELPYNAEYPNPGQQKFKLFVSLNLVSTLMGTGEDELIWNSSYQLDNSRSFIVIETYPKKNCGLLIRPIVRRRM
jgi:hypothetical protein